ncbi:MAG: hypothetical protein NW226_05215 [Microscillaceae bacterium]|nr:hypothetical protein [Microscillaceae bacterium]
MAYYKVIQGQYFDAALLNKGQSLTAGKGDGRISYEDAIQLYEEAMDGQEITEIEKATLLYLFNELPWTEKAREWITEKLAFLKTDPETGNTTVYRLFYEKELRNFWQARYEDHKNNVESEVYFWEQYLIDRDQELPATIRESIDYYYQSVEEADWGVVRLYFVPESTIAEGESEAKKGLYAVRVTTDGDDGWIELFDRQSNELGYGRTYIELVHWGEKEPIRAFVAGSGYPVELENSMNDTLWGK